MKEKEEEEGVRWKKRVCSKDVVGRRRPAVHGGGGGGGVLSHCADPTSGRLRLISPVDLMRKGPLRTVLCLC
ncbi:hypothetical protein M0802_001049 [Mischocyttarus mexicanus]|nr:hypothetical protein M0802_001049 [Mischocyttarus mexicanus]